MPRVYRLLDRLYDAAGYLAAGAIVADLLPWSALRSRSTPQSRIGGAGWSATIPSYADLSGFLLAAASFLALAHTLRRGAHIRVTLGVGRLAPRAALAPRMRGPSRWPPPWRASSPSTPPASPRTSWRYGDTSPGLLPVPLWIPQLPVCLGLGAPDARPGAHAR